MRSPELRPCEDITSDGRPGFFNEPELIAAVVAKRSALLPDCTIPSVVGGRLLIVDYEVTHFNEATEMETNGFFDFADNPPWDLWVGEVGGRLIAKVPSSFEVTVERAMRVEVMNMLQWVGDHEPLFDAPVWLALDALGCSDTDPTGRRH